MKYEIAIFMLGVLLKTYEKGDEQAKEFVPDYQEREHDRLAHIGIMLPNYQHLKHGG